MPLLQYLLRPFFFLLYHHFAWAYDIVAGLVSLGRWKQWVLAVLPYIDGPDVLELGHGPGHLQVALCERGYRIFGLDESRFMSRQAASRLKQRHLPVRLSRGYAQDTPHANRSFNTVVATFPSEYIFDPRSLIEIQRVLVPGGKLVLLPLAWITGKRPLDRLAAWLFRITGETPSLSALVPPELMDRFGHAGLAVQMELVQHESSSLLVIVAIKTLP